MRKHTREGAKLTQTVRYLILTFNIFVDEVLPFIQYLPRSKRLQSGPVNNLSVLLDKFHDNSKDKNLGEEGLNDYEGLVSTKNSSQESTYQGVTKTKTTTLTRTHEN